MNNERFDLMSSAFHILKAGYDANKSDISELVEDAEFDEVFDPQVVQSAQQSLLAPNARLKQEVSWLPELSQAQTSNILNLIGSGDLNALVESLKHAPELAKANVLAHSVCLGNANNSLLHALVAAWDEIDQANIVSFLNEYRMKAGFPSVDHQQVHVALKDLEKLHARSAAVGVWTLDHPGEAMDRIVAVELVRHSSGSFLEQFVRNYDTLSEPDLACINDEIDKVILDAENANADLGALVTKASDLLVQWDNVNQPVQVYEQHQGHEEGRSKRIYEKLRLLCLDLANNRNEFSEAQRLSKALLRTFPELESVAEVLKGDLEQLETLNEQQKFHQKYKELIDACEAAKTQLPTPVSAILKIFKDMVSRGADDPIPFNVVRDLALHINNDCNDPQTAFKLVDGVLTFNRLKFSQELRTKLEDDREVLHRNWKSNELEKHKGDNAVMAKIVDDMLIYARGPERIKLLKLKSNFDQKKNEKRGWWIMIGAVILLLIFFGG
jgi:hypothetical protein